MQNTTMDIIIEDVDEEESMPPKPQRAGSGSRQSNNTSIEEKEKRRSASAAGKGKRVPRSTSEVSGSTLVPTTDDDVIEEEFGEKSADAGKREKEQELHRVMGEVMGDVSRQRLRALQMALRRAGNTESRISSKDLLSVLQDNQVKLRGRSFNMLVELYEDPQGIDYERLWKSLVKAQNRSGRDSVLAQNKKVDISAAACTQTQEQVDADLLNRLEQQFLKASDPYSMADLRAEFQAKDVDKAGRLSKEDIFEACSKHHLPIYGALLTVLLQRCDEENTGKSSWPEVLSFLDKAREKLLANGLISDKLPEPEPPAKKISSISKTSGSPAPAPLEETKEVVKKVAPMPEPLRKELVKSAFKKALGEEGATTPRSPRPGSSNTQVKAASGFLTSMKSLLKGKVKPIEPSIAEPGKDSNQNNSTPISNLGVKAGYTTPPTQDKKLLAEDDHKPKSPKPSSRDSSAKAPSSPVPETPRPTPKPVSPKPSLPRGVLDVEVKGQRVRLPVADEHSNLDANTDPPQERLKLDWIYGYRGNDCRSNIYVLKSGEIVYFIGTTVILYTKESHVQRHYREHTHDIRCIAVHPNGITVASGQQETKVKAFDAHVRLWRSDTLQTLHILGMGTVCKAALCLSFSHVKEISGDAEQEKDDENAPGKVSFSEDRVCCVDDSSEHHLHVWDVTKGAFIAAAPLGIETVCDVDFNPTNASLMVVTGKEHLGWWMVYPENRLVQLHAKADYQNYLRARYVTAMLHNEKGDLITGDSNGTVYVWGKSGNLITNLIKHAHNGPVFSLLLLRSTLLTAGRDGIVYGWWWSKNMDQTAKLQLPGNEGGVRMLQVRRDCLLLGTTTNTILTAKLAGQALRNPLSGVQISSAPVTQGHYDCLSSVCTPLATPNRVITTGRDGVLNIYDTNTRKPVWKHSFKNCRIYSADVNHDGDYIVLATRDSVSLHHLARVEDPDQEHLSVEERRWHMEVHHVFSVKIKSTQRITHVKMSPDCLLVVAGDSGGGLYKIGVSHDEDGNEFWTVLAKSKKHTGSVEAIDWSKDKQDGVYYIRTSCSALQLHIWKVGNLMEVTDMASVNNIKWFSANCHLTFTTSGMWHSKQAQSADVTSVDVNPMGTLLAMGDSHGYLSLFRHPCIKKGAVSQMFKTHTHLRDARFTCDGTWLVTVGNSDTALYQWQIS